jgi:hypothetical protein
MPDFDVAAVGLQSPTPGATVSTYRPAVLVKNNGIGAANVAGYLRIYHREQPGGLIATHQLSLLNLQPGATGAALADGYWTPTEADIGKEFLFTAHVETDFDSVQTNNDLAPVTVMVIAGEPPPPPIVTSHASQHEAGGTDQLTVAGLPGELADDQPAKDHAGKHAQGGADELSLTGLTGLTATPQTAASHGNERHATAFASASQIATEIDDHDTLNTAHASSTSLERKANKDVIGGYAGLDEDGYLNPDVFHIHAPPNIAPLKGSEGGDPVDGVVAALHFHRAATGVACDTGITAPVTETSKLNHSYPAYFFGGTTDNYAFRVALDGYVTAAPGDVLTVKLTTKPNGSATSTLAMMALTFAAASPAAAPIGVLMDCVLKSAAGTLSGKYSYRATWATLVAETVKCVLGGGDSASFDGTIVGEIDVTIKWTGLGACVFRTASLVQTCDLVDASD